jgi:chitinase
MKGIILLSIITSLFFIDLEAQDRKEFAVVAYYAGHDTAQVDSFAIGKLTHIIFSFCHLQGNELRVDRQRDTLMIQKLVSLKQQYPGLKVMVSLGGWGGCAPCSPVFSSKDNRKAFALSVKHLGDYFGIDGLDLDWEYPGIEGYPGHAWKPEDRENFTSLVKELRKKLGKGYIISFAAGGFNSYIEQSIEWKKLAKKISFVNLMTYDLVSGFSAKTGHHTPLYSNDSQVESIDNAVRKLSALRFPKHKIVIGAAFYARVWEAVADTNGGLYQQGKFKRSVAYKHFNSEFSVDSGFVAHWDEKAKAPYFYNPSQGLFATYDDLRSMELKTRYAIEKGLGGIMFWELSNDSFEEGLLNQIYKTKLSFFKK